MKTPRFLLAAGLLLALAFIFSCSSDNGSSSSVAQGGISYGTLPYQGQNYKTVQIGTQIWMAENLNYNASGSKCYNNESSNCTTYGRLYDWATAKIVCPSGWHLPSYAEWTKLTDYVGGASTAGSKLKAKSGWNNSGNGIDDYGFSALPGGYGYSGGGFINSGYSGHWWSSSEDEGDSDRAYGRIMYYDYESAGRDIDYKTTLFSVRCVQD